MKLELFGLGVHLKFYKSGYRGKIDAMNRKLAKSRYAIAQLHKRISNGVCPCCTRTFDDMARHVEDSHPRYRAKVNP